MLFDLVIYNMVLDFIDEDEGASLLGVGGDLVRRAVRDFLLFCRCGVYRLWVDDSLHQLVSTGFFLCLWT